MYVELLNIGLFAIAVLAASAQMFLKPIRVEQILFAILCVSLAFASIQSLLPDSFVIEQQLAALCTFATCNVMWLLSRAMFRKKNALMMRHYAFAGLIAILVIISRLLDISVSMGWVQYETIESVKRIVRECLGMLSSVVLILPFWEAFREYSSVTRPEQLQRIAFASTLFTVVFTNQILIPSLVAESQQELVFEWSHTLSAISVIAVSFAVLLLQYKRRKEIELNGLDPAEQNRIEEDRAVLKSLVTLMEQDQLFLKADLKMVDLANALNLSEYRISRAIRNETEFENFNHYLNYHRIDHAKKLLEAEENKSWTILVVSMESGFASLAPFNRAFKSLVGCTPGEFRKRVE